MANGNAEVRQFDASRNSRPPGFNPRLQQSGFLGPTSARDLPSYFVHTGPGRELLEHSTLDIFCTKAAASVLLKI